MAAVGSASAVVCSPPCFCLRGQKRREGRQGWPSAGAEEHHLGGVELLPAEVLCFGPVLVDFVELLALQVLVQRLSARAKRLTVSGRATPRTCEDGRRERRATLCLVSVSVSVSP